MPIDTHRIFKRLTEAGVSQAECEALVETARELDDAPTRSDLKELETKLHKELHALSWRFFILMIAQSALILGAVCFMLSDVKSDLRELRTAVSHLSPTK
jgi:hypothetical protein